MGKENSQHEVLSHIVALLATSLDLKPLKNGRFGKLMSKYLVAFTSSKVGSGSFPQKLCPFLDHACIIAIWRCIANIGGTWGGLLLCEWCAQAWKEQDIRQVREEFGSNAFAKDITPKSRVVWGGRIHLEMPGYARMAFILKSIHINYFFVFVFTLSAVRLKGIHWIARGWGRSSHTWNPTSCDIHDLVYVEFLHGAWLQNRSWDNDGGIKRPQSISCAYTQPYIS